LLTGVFAQIATGLMAFAVPGRMFGREEIEWKDRSWRLMENKGQLEVCHTHWQLNGKPTTDSNLIIDR